MESTRKLSSEKILAQILSVVRNNPGIRPSEINRLINRTHSAYYRAVLIQQGLISKEKDGSAVRYYLT